MEEEDSERPGMEMVARLEEKWYEMGFREGLLKGKLEVAQDAFDKGFHSGAIDEFIRTTSPMLAKHHPSKLSLLSQTFESNALGLSNSNPASSD